MTGGRVSRHLYIVFDSSPLLLSLLLLSNGGDDTARSRRVPIRIIYTAGDDEKHDTSQYPNPTRIRPAINNHYNIKIYRVRIVRY